MINYNLITCDTLQVTSSFTYRSVNYPIAYGNREIGGDIYTQSYSPVTLSFVNNTYKLESDNQAHSCWCINVTGSNYIGTGSFIISSSYCDVTFQPSDDFGNIIPNCGIEITPINNNVIWSSSYNPSGSSLVLKDTLFYTSSLSGSVSINLLSQPYWIQEIGTTNNTPYRIYPTGSSCYVNQCWVQSSLVSAQINLQNQSLYSYTAQSSDARYLPINGTASYAITASYSLNGSSGGGSSVSSSWASQSLSSSYAQTASAAYFYNPILYDSDDNQFYTLTVTGQSGHEILNVVQVNFSGSTSPYTASFAYNSLTASYALNGGSGGNSISSSFASASNYSISSSWASQSVSSSYVSGAVVTDTISNKDTNGLTIQGYTSLGAGSDIVIQPGGGASGKGGSTYIRSAGGTPYGYIYLQTYNGSGGYNTIVTVTGSQVGINDSNPMHALDVGGDINISGDLYKLGVLYIPQSSSYATTSSYALTSSYITSSNIVGTVNNSLSSNTATSSSFASSSNFSVSASWASQSLSASWAPPIASNYSVSSSWASASLFTLSSSYASQSLSSSYSNNTLSSSYSVTASYALTAGGGSGGTTLVTASTYQITSSWAINSLTTSFVTGSNVVGIVNSAIYANSASYYSGSVTSASFASASNFSVSASWSSASIFSTSASYSSASSFLNGPHTGSTFGTASYAITASYVLTSSYIVSSSFASSSNYSISSSYASQSLWSVSSSFASASISSSWSPFIPTISASWASSSIWSTSSSFASQSISSSYAVTASFSLNGGGSGTTLVTASTYQITSSWAVNSLTSSYCLGSITTAVSASWASASISSSYALTASYAANAGGGSGTTLVTASTYQITSSWANNSLTSSYLQQISTSLTSVSQSVSSSIYVVNYQNPYYYLTASNSNRTMSFASSSNINTGFINSTVIFIESFTGSMSCSFNKNWVFLGSVPVNNLTASKNSVLSFTSYGGGESAVLISYAQQY